MPVRSILGCLAVTSLAALGMVAMAWRQTREQTPARWRFEGSQAAAEPLALPAGDEPDMRFRWLSPWELAATPMAHRFDPPLGALIYNAQPFWEMNAKRGGHHTGDDLNGIGGMNTDFGDPVFAVADGRVVYAGDPSPGWGNIVIVAHRRPDGAIVQSMYAHLDRFEVSRGQLVARGQRIAAVGTAHGHYPAHLHFEMRTGEGIDVGAGYGGEPLNRVDPMRALREWRGAAADDFAPSPLGVLLGGND